MANLPTFFPEVDLALKACHACAEELFEIARRLRPSDLYLSRVIGRLGAEIELMAMDRLSDAEVRVSPFYSLQSGRA